MAEHFITLAGIAKLRGGVPVLRAVDFAVAPGELHLILGANGAGKSTLLRIMAGLLAPSDGTINRREDVALAYLGHATFLYGNLTAMQNLQFQARINSLKVSEDTLFAFLDRMGLGRHAHTKARFFSRGMAQRLNFCRALLINAQLLLLDEPFTGMDPASRESVGRELAIQREEGRGIVLVSHDPKGDASLASHCHELISGRLRALEPAPC